MADLSDDESFESEPELMTCGELKMHYRIRIEHLVALSSSSLADVALATQVDMKIGKEIVIVLKHAKDTRKRDFEKFSKAMAKHRYVVARKMEDLREKKTAHNTGVPGSAIALVGVFAEVEEAVRTQRDMERAACKMLALTGVTDSHLTVLDTVCLKISNSLNLNHSKGYCERVLGVLDPLADELIVPEDIVDMSPNPFKGLEVVQENIDYMYALKRANAHAWTVALPEAWNHLWELCVTYRKGGAFEDEVRVLWYMTMRRRLSPSTVERLRKLLEVLKESAKAKETPVEGAANQEESGTTIKEQSQDPKPITDPAQIAMNFSRATRFDPPKQTTEEERQHPKPITDPAQIAVDFSRATRVDPPKQRTKKERQQLLSHTYKLLSNRREPRRTSVRKKGEFERFLESFYDHLDGREDAESQTDLNVLAARINGKSSAEGKRNKASTSLEDPLHASYGPSIISKSMAQSAPIADNYLDLYYENFEKDVYRAHAEDEVIKIAEEANRKFNDIWGWQPTINDVTLLETKLIDKITK
jgi:hypothetical protein